MEKFVTVKGTGKRSGVQEVGKYNVSFEGYAYESGVPFQMVIIFKFDKNNKQIGKKAYYFYTAKDYIVPRLNSEKEVDEVFSYPDNTRFRCERKTIFHVI